jgi:hypothetical protein
LLGCVCVFACLLACLFAWLFVCLFVRSLVCSFVCSLVRSFVWRGEGKGCCVKSIVPREDDTLFNCVPMFPCSLLVLDLLAEDVFMFFFVCSNRATGP